MKEEAPERSLDCAVGWFFSSRRRHTRLQGDWSSDVCSSDLFSAEFPTGTRSERSGRLVTEMANSVPATGMMMPTPIRSSVRTSSLREIENFFFPMARPRTATLPPLGSTPKGFSTGALLLGMIDLSCRIGGYSSDERRAHTQKQRLPEETRCAAARLPVVMAVLGATGLRVHRAPTGRRT